LVFSEVKTGRACNFPQTAPSIIPDQKVIAGALNAVAEVVVECIKSASWNGGDCVPVGAPTLK